MSNNPGPLPPKLAVAEYDRLRQIEPALAQAYARTKELYLAKFPERARPFITCGYRSDEEQAHLYAKGRTAPGKIVTYSKPGQSKHNSNPAHALDVGFLSLHYELDWSEQQFHDFADLLLPKFPLVHWGGHFSKFKDLPHFELA